MINLILTILVLLVALLVFKAFTGKNKCAEERSALERIACSLLTLGRGQVEDAANSIRTASVVQSEAKQEVSDAIMNLKSSYKASMIQLKTAQKQLEEVTLPKLRDEPGKLEAKARKAKKDYEASVAKGTPIGAYKTNAKNYIKMKLRASENIKKSEKMLEKLNITIETSKAEYDGNLTELEMIQSEILTQVSIPQLQLNESLTRIRSLQNELSSRMSQDQIRGEVERELNGSIEDAFSEDIESEFNKL